MSKKRTIRILFIVLFFFIANLYYAQKDSFYLIDKRAISSINPSDKTLLDEVLKKYHNSNSDTVKIQLLEELVNSLIDIKLWPLYNEIVKIECEKKLKEPNLPERTKFIYKQELASYYNSRSVEASEMGDFTSSLNLSLNALNILNEIKDEKGQADVYHNIASTYYWMEKFDLSLSYSQKCIAYFEKINKSDLLAPTYNNIGLIFLERKQFDSAKVYFDRSLKIFWQNKDTANTMHTYLNLGLTESDKTNYEKAVEYYNQALTMAEKYGDLRTTSKALNAIANCYFIMNKGNAFEYSQKAYVIAKKTKSIELLKESTKIYYEILKRKGNYEKSLEIYEEHVKYADSLKNENIHKSQLKKQLELDYAVKENALKMAQEHEIAISEEEKRNQKLIIYSISLILGISVVLGLLILRGLKQQKKANTVISQQKEEVERAKEEITLQKELVDEKQKEILDSIHYAKRIQNTLLAHTDFVNDNLPENFILFKPKDIVSGDFYWATRKNNLFYLAVCDSTGHGVPGAFMSLLNIGFLSEAINEKNISQPDKILNHVRERLINSVSKDGQQDGFDGVLMCFDSLSGQISYSAAHNAPMLIHNKQLIQLEANRMPVGKGEYSTEFSLHYLDVEAGDTLYLYTDGYADQFGGPKGKKFKYKQLNDVLLQISSLSMQDQKLKLDSVFENWKGNLEQVDDVLLIGIKI